MAPTIDRQWRGGPQDYAALCDYCDVRYLRSQLRKQSNGRLACFGPGTNSCGAGRDEVALDKINAERMRNRRRPTKHDGGRFDRIRASVTEIFGAQLAESWDATKGIVYGSSDRRLISWTGERGAVFTADATFGKAQWWASMPEFYGRPGVVIDGGPEVGAIWGATGNFIPSGGRPYFGAVFFNHSDDQSLGTNGGIVFMSSVLQASIGRSVSEHLYRALYKSVANPVGTELPIPAEELGSVRQARLYELDATGPFAFRAGTAELQTSVDSPALAPWQDCRLFPGLSLTLLVVANNPSALQIDEFQSLARSYAVLRP